MQQSMWRDAPFPSGMRCVQSLHIHGTSGESAKSKLQKPEKEDADYWIEVSSVMMLANSRQDGCGSVRRYRAERRRSRRECELLEERRAHSSSSAKPSCRGPLCGSQRRRSRPAHSATSDATRSVPGQTHVHSLCFSYIIIDLTLSEILSIKNIIHVTIPDKKP